MTSRELQARLVAIVSQTMPLPGGGQSSERLQLLAETAREDISLAKLAEAHWDAVAILAEAGRAPQPGTLYAVWASEIPGQTLRLERTSDGYELSGRKPFCSGIGIVDCALITVGLPEQLLVEADRYVEGRCLSRHANGSSHLSEFSTILECCGGHFGLVP
jgi:hypothetical protein